MRWTLTFPTLGLALVAACAVQPEGPDPVTGRMLFQENCALCHGASGQGDGLAATGLTPPPSDLTRIAARNGGTFPRAETLSQIDGYTRGGDALMPEFGDAFAGDLVPLDTGDGILTPTPVDLVSLLEYLESIQRAD